MDLDCSNIETEFKSSLEYFKSFADEWIALKENKDYSKREVEFVFNKTMTVNEKELIENCNNSIEILSRKTILAKHPYVEDVEDEETKLETEEKAEKAKEDDEYTKMINGLKNGQKGNVGAKVGDK